MMMMLICDSVIWIWNVVDKLPNIWHDVDERRGGLSAGEA